MKTFKDFLIEAGRYRDHEHSHEEDKAVFKSQEMRHELRGEERLNNYGIFINDKFWKAVKNERHAESIVNSLKKKGKEAFYKLGVYQVSESSLNEGSEKSDMITKVGKVLGDRAYHDDMGGGRGAINGIDAAAEVLAIVFNETQYGEDAIATKLRKVAEKEKKLAFKEKRGY